MAAFLTFLLIFSSGLFFKVKEIRVEGAVVVSAAEAIELSGFDHGDNILLINKTAARRALTSSLPYVRDVRVKRELPGRVVIIITEAEAAAMAAYRGSHWLFDFHGNLLEEASRAGLPLVTGLALQEPVAGTKLHTEPEDEAKIEPLLDLLRVMSCKGMLNEVGEINLSRLSNITFTYMERLRVELGAPEGFLRKIELMLGSFEQEGVPDAGPGTFYFGEGRHGRFAPDPQGNFMEIPLDNTCQ
jgi:cell division protein FtsQ